MRTRSETSGRDGRLAVSAGPRGRWLEVFAIVLLAALLLVRFGQLRDAALLDDERFYLTAFELAGAGSSPYQGDYLYLPALAVAGGFLLDHLGEQALVVVMRAANLLALAAIVWSSMSLAGLGSKARFVASALYLTVLSAPVYFALEWGNLSPVAVGLLLVSLSVWPRRPVLAGLLLGASMVVKPLAPVAIAVIATHRDVEAGARRSPTAFEALLRRLEIRPAQLLTGAVAAALSLIVVIWPPYLGEFLKLQVGRPLPISNVSLHRLLWSFGVAVPATWLALAVLAAAVLCGRVRSLRQGQVHALVVAATLWSIPVVWSHTLLLALPLEVLALRLAVTRWRAGASAPSRRLELVLVAGSVLAVQLPQGLTGYGDRPFPVQGLVQLWPVLAPVALAAYVGVLLPSWLEPAALQRRAPGVPGV